MSLKLLIADDEYSNRQSIKKIIPWEKLNLIFAGEAENCLLYTSPSPRDS